ncbi:MAG: glucosamine-6-phosphate deaminase [Lachnospiraceae bacterium]|jgi:glucosamine-6-phosphate deaminase|nr:glucosamine-6-phosphate deaminase [Lachnospiraceae bacterium]
MLKVIRTKNYDDMSRKAANIIAAQVILKSDSVLGLATGSTPVGLYRELIRGYENGDLDFSHVRTVNLDEYQGLPREHDQSYYYFMNENLFKHININLDQTHLPDGTNMDAEGECGRYHELIESMGGIDLQLLGIGNNGHIGFNEPADAFADHTHCIRLTESTIKANARFFASEADVPRYAYTMGIGEIMTAKKILIVASGKAKAPIIREMLNGPVTPQVPASVLRFHKDVVLVADEEALSLV